MSASEAQALRSFRRALLIALIAPVFEYIRFVVSDRSVAHWPLAAGFAVLLPVAASALWVFGFPIIRFVSALLHVLLGGRSLRQEWQEATFAGIRPLPCICALGVPLWLTYSLSRFGGYPGDVIFGTLGNRLGAWLYVALIWQWYLLQTTR